MVNGRHIFGGRHRLFVSPALGCTSVCSYCYLKDIGYSLGAPVEVPSLDELIRDLESTKGTLWLPEETIVSIGCFTDPWARQVKERVTLGLLEYFDLHGNPLTISSKHFVGDDDARFLSELKGLRDFVFLVSMPVLSNNTEFEKGVSSVDGRERSLDNLANYGVRSGLYIKPVIPRVTIHSLDHYCSLLERYKVPVVLGRMFKKRDDVVVFLECEGRFDEYDIIFSALSNLTNVYEHSIDILGE